MGIPAPQRIETTVRLGWLAEWSRDGHAEDRASRGAPSRQSRAAAIRRGTKLSRPAGRAQSKPRRRAPGRRSPIARD